jgi:hypothetical protein
VVVVLVALLQVSTAALAGQAVARERMGLVQHLEVQADYFLKVLAEAHKLTQLQAVVVELES